MNDTHPTQVSGDGERAISSDGVADAPGKQAGGGESSGGAYPDPDVEHDKGTGGFLGHGGQHDIAYSGTGDEDDGDDNPNAATK